MKSSFQRISVVGLGYIGLPTAAVIASRGIEVVGVEISPKVVETINQGKVHIVEPELDVLVRGAVHSGKLRAVLAPEAADAFIVAVPTPFQEGHKPDLIYIQAAAKAIASVLKRGDLVILESTSPVGTTEQLVRWLSEHRRDLKFPETDIAGDVDVNIAYCPERVLPGQVLRELVDNDRVIGGITTRCGERARDLYKIFVEGECLVTNSRTAEMVKLTENAFRDVNIAFANELSLICEELNISVWKLIELANRHPRVKILQPGPGVGGHCIAVDPWFIVDRSPQTAKLIRQAREINDHKSEYVCARIRSKASNFKQPTIACLGLAFKPNIDDLRESPALEITEHLSREKNFRVLAVEPNIESLPAGLASSAVSLVNLETAIKEADILVFLVRHKEFVALDRAVLAEKVVLDFVDCLQMR